MPEPATTVLCEIRDLLAELVAQGRRPKIDAAARLEDCPTCGGGIELPIP